LILPVKKKASLYIIKIQKQGERAQNLVRREKIGVVKGSLQNKAQRFGKKVFRNEERSPRGQKLWGATGKRKRSLARLVNGRAPKKMKYQRQSLG